MLFSGSTEATRGVAAGLWTAAGAAASGGGAGAALLAGFSGFGRVGGGGSTEATRGVAAGLWTATGAAAAGGGAGAVLSTGTSVFGGSMETMCGLAGDSASAGGEGGEERAGNVPGVAWGDPGGAVREPGRGAFGRVGGVMAAMGAGRSKKTDPHDRSPA